MAREIVAIAVLVMLEVEAMSVDFGCFASQCRNAKYARHAVIAANVPITRLPIADVSCSI